MTHTLKRDPVAVSVLVQDEGIRRAGIDAFLGTVLLALRHRPVLADVAVTCLVHGKNFVIDHEALAVRDAFPVVHADLHVYHRFPSLLEVERFS
jgi:hypothetical protein